MDIKYKLWRLYRLIFKPCALEINLVSHCNLNCVSCTHYSPIAAKSFLDLDQFKISLSYLSKISHSFKILRLLGGEPLLHPHINEILQLAGEQLKDKRIELYTNGILLDPQRNNKISERFWEICKQYNIIIYFTLYPVQIDHEEIIKVCRQKGVKIIIMGDKRNLEGFSLFRLHPNKSGNKLNHYTCSETGCMQLVGNKIYPCSESAYADYLNDAYGTTFHHTKGDYIEIEQVKHRYSLWLFRLKSKPFCSYCEFPRPPIAWRHSLRESQEWITKI